MIPTRNCTQIARPFSKLAIWADVAEIGKKLPKQNQTKRA